jgi:hypothetical protein
MNHSQLATRTALAIQSISESLNVDLAGLPRAINTEHRHLFVLERIAESVKNQSVESSGFTLDEILAVDGLSKTSIKALEAALNGSSD